MKGGERVLGADGEPGERGADQGAGPQVHGQEGRRGPAPREQHVRPRRPGDDRMHPALRPVRKGGQREVRGDLTVKSRRP
eukprot:1176908-Prorocentrum_minimum.AAC.2